MKPHQKTFDRIREAVLPEFRERVADYLVDYEHVLQDEAADADQISASAQQLRGYLRGLNTTRVLGMADWEDLDRRVLHITERSTAQDVAD
jgi:predicted transcriptional regulator